MTSTTVHPAQAPLPGAPPEDVRVHPVQPLHHLDVLWVQVAGTACNLTCTHCFVSCGPGDHRLPFMSREAVRAHVAEAMALGVREIAFTGGEPFLHPEMLAILADTLPLAPCTVLTNGTLLTRGRIDALATLATASRFSLELRVSLDGLDAASHDAVRGPGTFVRTIAALRALEAAGLLPIVTLTLRDREAPLDLCRRALERLRAEGLARPRLKLLPLFALGREASRGGAESRATLAGLGDAFDPHRLQCGSCRAVSGHGVHVCPLLVDEPGGRMGARLGQALGGFTLSHPACLTCWVSGMTCANA